MWHELWVATALILVLEGLVPFINPDLMRHALITMAQLDNASLRYGGLVSMLLGLAILYAVN